MNYSDYYKPPSGERRKTNNTPYYLNPVPGQPFEGPGNFKLRDLYNNYQNQNRPPELHYGFQGKDGKIRKGGAISYDNPMYKRHYPNFKPGIGSYGGGSQQPPYGLYQPGYGFQPGYGGQQNYGGQPGYGGGSASMPYLQNDRDINGRLPGDWNYRLPQFSNYANNVAK